MESTEYKISDEDKTFINAGTTDEDKALRTTIIQRALDINGAVEEAQPGMAVSYINRENYARIVDISGMAITAQAVLEQALNWESLGRGKGGLAGAAVRAKLRHLLDPGHESVLVTVFDVKWVGLMKDYSEFCANNKHFYATWFANAWNVLGLATSSFIRICHHWDSQNTRPIKALCGSLNMDAELPESEYRKTFYLAIHPIPLKFLTAAYVKGKNINDKDVSETVRQRLNVPPAGYADFCACGVAAQAFLTEKYAGHSYLLHEINEICARTSELRDNPLGYNQFATLLGVKKLEFNKSRYTESMIVLAAYTKSQIGGTLAKSPALNKFIEANQRKVNRFIDAFDKNAQQRSDDLFAMITGRGVTDLDDLPNKLKPLMKVQSAVADFADQNVRASINDLIATRVEKIIAETEEFIAKPVAIPIDEKHELTVNVEDEELRAFLQSGTRNILRTYVAPAKPVVIVPKAKIDE